LCRNAVALELVASCLVLAGICIEVMIGGEAGYILITLGSLGIVAGSVIYAKKFIKEP